MLPPMKARLHLKVEPGTGTQINVKSDRPAIAAALGATVWLPVQTGHPETGSDLMRKWKLPQVFRRQSFQCAWIKLPVSARYSTNCL